MGSDRSRLVAGCALILLAACGITRAKVALPGGSPLADPYPGSVVAVINQFPNPGFQDSKGEGYKVPLKGGQEYSFDPHFHNSTTSMRWVIIYRRRSGIPDAQCQAQVCWERAESFSTDNLNRDTYRFRPPADTHVLIATWNEGIGASDRFGATHNPAGKEAHKGGTLLRFRGATPSGAVVQTTVAVLPL